MCLPASFQIATAFISTRRPKDDFRDFLPDAGLTNLAEQIAGQWATASWPGLRRLKVEATTDAIRVKGNVSRFFEKQQAWHWARRVARDVQVEDEIEVISRHPR
jgi:hypothetical protein